LSELGGNVALFANQEVPGQENVFGAEGIVSGFAVFIEGHVPFQIEGPGLAVRGDRPLFSEFGYLFVAFDVMAD
jgi:hypothetical protein